MFICRVLIDYKLPTQTFQFRISSVMPAPITLHLSFQTCLSKRDDELAAEKERETRQQSARQPKSHDPSGLPITTGGEPRSPEDLASADGGGEGSAVAGVVIFLIVVAVVGVGAFVILRTRLAPRLRARLTNTPYGDIVGGTGIGGFGAGGRSDSSQNVIA